MNAARKRRLALQERIKKIRSKKGRFRDIAKLINKCGHNRKPSDCTPCMEERTKSLLDTNRIKVPVWIGLKDIRKGKLTVVECRLPADKMTETILNMQKNGFWNMYNGFPTYFPPKSIWRVEVDTGAS